MKPEQLYWSLPIFLQEIAVNIESRRICNKRYSKDFFNVLYDIKDRNKLNKHELEEYLVNRLKDNLIVAYENTDYYNKLFKQYDFDPYNFKNLNEIKKLPIQTKNEVKNNLENISNKNIREKVFKTYTSGTTGSGLVFPRTKISENETYAVWWRYWNNLGIKFKMHCAYFGGPIIAPIKQKKPPFWRYAKAANQTIFSIYHLKNETIQYYVEELNRQRIQWIHGNPASLAYFASLMLDNNLKLDYELKFITIGAESLLDHQINVISKCFGIKPKQHYGLAENVANISECEYGKLHIDEDFSFVELVPFNDIPGLYRLIGTSLVNKAFFFLRYDTNDLVVPSANQNCPCGNTGRIIDSIEGRADDLITLKDGRKVGRLPQLFKDMINVQEAQIRQDKEGNITFYIVKNSYYSQKDEDKLKYNIYKRLNIDYYQIKYVDKIKRSKRGKLKYVVSEFKK
jgi:phenylacetate-CoA ligase